MKLPCVAPMQPEFEAVFRVYDESVQFNYLKSFGRVRVIYTTIEQAQLAQGNLNSHVFDGNSLQLRPVKVNWWTELRKGRGRREGLWGARTRREGEGGGGRREGEGEARTEGEGGWREMGVRRGWGTGDGGRGARREGEGGGGEGGGGRWGKGVRGGDGGRGWGDRGWGREGMGVGRGDGG